MPPPPTQRLAPKRPVTEAQTPDDRERIWQAVHAIPRGRVSTYGAVALLAGLPRRARLVGRVLSDLPTGTKLPWHRVVNASGRISVRGVGENVQRARLRREGVVFVGERIDLRQYGWPEDAHV